MTLLHQLSLNIDIIPLPGLETEIAVKGIRVSHDRNNGMLIIYYEVHECTAYLTKTIIGVHNKRHYVSLDQIQDGLLLSLGDGCTKSNPKHILRFVKVWS